MKPYVDLKAKVSLNLLLRTDVSLLAASAAQIELEIEKEERSAYVTLVTKKIPRWFYWDTPRELDVPHMENEINELINQARLELDGKDFEIAQELLYSVNDRGYLKVSLEEIAKALLVDVRSVEKVRRFIVRELEPVGVCCKDLYEFIQVQLEELYPKESGLHERVIHALKTGRVYGEIKEVLSCLKLSPLSGKIMYRSGPVDVVIDNVGGEWVIFIYDDFVDIQIKEPNEDDAIRKAKNLRFVMQMRRDVLRKVVHEVLRVQEGFLVNGSPLKKLTLTEVANRLGVDVSTLSRIVSNKYIKTPLGVYSLRFFFVRESLEGFSIEEIARLIKDALKELGEDATDKKISMYLEERGIKLSRRTVNKYRKMIGKSHSTDAK